MISSVYLESRYQRFLGNQLLYLRLYLIVTESMIHLPCLPTTPIELLRSWWTWDFLRIKLAELFKQQSPGPMYRGLLVGFLLRPTPNLGRRLKDAAVLALLTILREVTAVIATDPPG
jgi:hypothetical protein